MRLRARVWLSCLAGTSAILLAAGAESGKYCGWPAYGGGEDVMRYSALDQINRKNVKDLQVAWTFDFEDAFPGSQIQATPVMVDNVLYVISPRSRVAALEADTGKLIWKFDPVEGPSRRGGSRTRGVTYWTD
ncbi:MAG: PQQ-binding-like beta-propeller repeat protein, partial [Bryobacteraceae bacterium]|nr:PQQ-binding-like beta-propeller repeat protein [Bryobacteraceae bacterium]